MMARAGVLAIVLVSALLVRTVVAPIIAVAGVVPDPVLLTVVALALGDGPRTGARYGFAAGLAVDLLGGSDLLVGTWSLAFSVAGWGVGVLRTYLTGSPLVTQLGAATAAALMAIGIAGVMAMLLDSGRLTPVDMLVVAFGTALYNLPFVPVVVPTVATLSRRWSAAPPVPA